MLIVCSAGLFVIRHCCGRWHSARRDIRCASRVCANRTSTGGAPAPRAEKARPAGRTPAAHRTMYRGALAWIFHCVQAVSAYPNLNPHAFQRHGARQWSWGSACAAARPLVRPMPVVGRVLVPRAYLRSRCAERHELACAVWGARENINTFEVGRGSGVHVGPDTK
jgi:hypothetical protein